MSDEPKTPVARVVLWAAACAVMVCWVGPTVVQGLRPRGGQMMDFFQDWASARYFLVGKSIYAGQRKAARGHLGDADRSDGSLSTR